MGVRINGEDKVAYNHCDSYPDGLGDDIVKMIRTTLSDSKGLDWLKDKADALRVVDEKTVPTAEDIERLRPFTNNTVSTPGKVEWYKLLREAQGDLRAILSVGIVEDAHQFLEDSLFCEWAYIVNLDEMKFEVYQGFQKNAHSKGRYTARKSDCKYYPVALVASFPLTDIPKNWKDRL